MKRVAVGAVLVSLLGGSVAMAGQGYGREFGLRHEAATERNAAPDRSHDERAFQGRNDQRDERRDEHGRNDVRGRNDRHGRDDHWSDGRQEGRRDDRDHRGDWRDHDRRDSGWYGPRYVAPRESRSDWRGGRHYYGEYRRPWGYYDHAWRRGERLPVAYYGRPYIVEDYRDCGLRAPPRGYHWVRVNNDAVLAVIATGIVLDVVYNQFF